MFSLPFDAGIGMTVEEFMQRALYAPGAGYYSARIGAVGARGDFSTGPSISGWMGKAIAAWIRAHPGLSTVIEIGAGSGALAEAVLQALGWWKRHGIRYRIVDISPPLRRLQAARLKKFRQVQWHVSVADALREASGEALLFSNELFDAFPCRRLEWAQGSWRETELVRQGEGWTERASATPTNLSAEHFSALGNWHNLREGQRIEIHPSVREWLAEWAPLWRKGAMLTLDYGDLFPAIYERRPRGSLRGYFKQIRMEGDEVFSRAGHQDITADVNFTDLMRWGAERNWTTEWLATQREFLLKYSPRIRKASEAAAEFLLNPEGMGIAFKALVQTVG